MPTDPVCGMYVDERSAELTLVRENRSYYFCSSSCLDEFAAPERQIRRLRQRLAVAWPLSLAILVLTYVPTVPGIAWLLFPLATVVQFYPGWTYYRGTADALRNRLWNMDILIAVGTTIAYAYSVVALLRPGALPSASFFDASSLIITLILTGNYLEHLTRERARGALRHLGEMLPTTAVVVREGREVEVALGEVRRGDELRVRPGGRIPADGTIVEGRTEVDEALLTGESLPQPKRPGDRVVAGSLNGDGAIRLRATGVGEDTLLAQIGRLMTEAETSRIPLQRLANRIASIFVPFVLTLAVVVTLGWAYAGVGLTVALLVFVSIVITACPCAFSIATPAAIVVGTGRAAEAGILFQGHDALEQASRADVVLTDKTGTLTRGVPVLTDIVPIPGATESELLRLAAGLEATSEHPLGRAVREAGAHRAVLPAPATDVRALPGRGIEGTIEGRPGALYVGSAAEEMSIDLGPWAASIDRFRADGKSWSIVLRDGRPLGVLAFSDEIRPEAAGAVRALAQDGIPVVMVTGDQAPAAERVARALGISEVHPGVSPAGKLALIREFQARGRHVAFVGDGVNDAPALAAADLGVAIGAGSDVAKAAGGVVLVRSDLSGVALALRIGRRTVRKVRTNLLWALGYNAVLLPIAAGALVPLLGLGVYDVLPITGAIAMGLSSTTVVLNSLSLRFVSLDSAPASPPHRSARGAVGGPGI